MVTSSIAGFFEAHQILSAFLSVRIFCSTLDSTQIFMCWPHAEITSSSTSCLSTLLKLSGGQWTLCQELSQTIPTVSQIFWMGVTNVNPDHCSHTGSTRHSKFISGINNKTTWQNCMHPAEKWGWLHMMCSHDIPYEYWSSRQVCQRHAGSMVNLRLPFLSDSWHLLIHLLSDLWRNNRYKTPSRSGRPPFLTMRKNHLTDVLVHF